jgi:phosphoribosyl 1,2-cyclic phosphodiesterase
MKATIVNQLAAKQKQIKSKKTCAYRTKKSFFDASEWVEHVDNRIAILLHARREHDHMIPLAHLNTTTTTTQRIGLEIEIVQELPKNEPCAESGRREAA